MSSGEPGVRRILVVDDDPDILDAMSLVLESAGYVVETARDGVAALAMLSRGAQPSLILLDLMMPVMSGWDFMAEATQDPALAAIPVVIVTGDARAVDKAKAMGGVGVLQKPMEIEALLAMVTRYC